MIAWLLIGLGASLWVPASVRYRLPGRPCPRLRVPRRHRRRSDSVVEVLGGLRDELLAGAALRVAFERSVMATGDTDVCSESLAVCRMGGDVATALRRDGRSQPLLLSLAALWQVSEGSGSALAAALERLLDGAVQSARLRREVAGQLAGPRATMRVLAVLPVVGIGMGLLMGANPIGFLLGTVWGWGCLVAAVVLEILGVLWIRAMVHGIERQI